MLNLTFDGLLHIVIVLFVFAFAPPSFTRRFERLSIELTQLVANHYTAISMIISGARFRLEDVS